MLFFECLLDAIIGELAANLISTRRLIALWAENRHIF